MSPQSGRPMHYQKGCLESGCRQGISHNMPGVLESKPCMKRCPWHLTHWWQSKLADPTCKAHDGPAEAALTALLAVQVLPWLRLSTRAPVSRPKTPSAPLQHIMHTPQHHPDPTLVKLHVEPWSMPGNGSKRTTTFMLCTTHADHGCAAQQGRLAARHSNPLAATMHRTPCCSSVPPASGYTTVGMLAGRCSGCVCQSKHLAHYAVVQQWRYAWQPSTHAQQYTVATAHQLDLIRQPLAPS